MEKGKGPRWAVLLVFGSTSILSILENSNAFLPGVFWVWNVGVAGKLGDQGLDMGWADVPVVGWVGARLAAPLGCARASGREVRPFGRVLICLI